MQLNMFATYKEEDIKDLEAAIEYFEYMDRRFTAGQAREVLRDMEAGKDVAEFEYRNFIDTFKKETK